MLLVHDLDEEGQERVLVLPLGSIVSYFTERSDQNGLILHSKPGLYVFSGQFEAHAEVVREAILTEAGRRLHVPPAEVVDQSLNRLKEVADSSWAVWPSPIVRKR